MESVLNSKSTNVAIVEFMPAQFYTITIPIPAKGISHTEVLEKAQQHYLNTICRTDFKMRKELKEALDVLIKYGMYSCYEGKNS